MSLASKDRSCHLQVRLTGLSRRPTWSKISRLVERKGHYQLSEIKNYIANGTISRDSSVWSVQSGFFFSMFLACGWLDVGLRRASKSGVNLVCMELPMRECSRRSMQWGFYYRVRTGVADGTRRRNTK